MVLSTFPVCVALAVCSCRYRLLLWDSEPVLPCLPKRLKSFDQLFTNRRHVFGVKFSQNFRFRGSATCDSRRRRHGEGAQLRLRRNVKTTKFKHVSRCWDATNIRSFRRLDFDADRSHFEELDAKSIRTANVEEDHRRHWNEERDDHLRDEVSMRVQPRRAVTET